MLAAGLKGIEEGLEPPEPVEENVYEMSAKERKDRGIFTLPGSLEEALALTEKSKLVREALGDHVFNAFIENKKIEWNQYRIHVSKYEIDRYLPML
jgi:glutamine synthetase